jgi:hypothetical protein
MIPPRRFSGVEYEPQHAHGLPAGDCNNAFGAKGGGAEASGSRAATSTYRTARPSIVRPCAEFGANATARRPGDVSPRTDCHGRRITGSKRFVD